MLVLFIFPMPEPTVILDAVAIQRALTRIAHEIAERNEISAEVVLVGIPTGGGAAGAAVGQHFVGNLETARARRHARCEHAPRRSGPARRAENPSTVIPFDVTGKTVVLVDDVLFSGRTIRAAMDALNDFGRPKKIQLAVLVDRGHRELPIKADFVGKNVPTALGEKISLRLAESGEGEVLLERK